MGLDRAAAALGEKKHREMFCITLEQKMASPFLIFFVSSCLSCLLSWCLLSFQKWFLCAVSVQLTKMKSRTEHLFLFCFGH